MAVYRAGSEVVTTWNRINRQLKREKQRLAWDRDAVC
jgi:hypothetical protein